MGITICRCCGGPIRKGETALNPHVCASCQWLEDESELPGELESDQPPAQLAVPDRNSEQPAEFSTLGKLPRD